jgi:ribonuclease-3
VDGSVQPVLRADSLTEPLAVTGLERALGHRFRDIALLMQAVTHSGAHHGRGDVDNERLEFLGDRVLGLVVAQLLIERFPNASEGELSPRLTALVRREALAEIAAAIDLGAYLVLAPADVASGARTHAKMLADACEAVIAALYLDGGLEAARRFIADRWAAQFDRLATLPVEPKTMLQEWAQGQGKPLPLYNVVRAAGQAHDPVFEVRVEIQGVEPAQGAGNSKRAAEKAAALALLQRLGMAPAGPA